MPNRTRPDSGFSADAGVTWVAQREDIPAGTSARIDGEDDALACLYAAYAVNDRRSGYAQSAAPAFV